MPAGMVHPDDTIADGLSRFAAGLDHEAVPEAVRNAARLHLLDAVGVAYASASIEFVRRTLEGLADFGPGEYEVIGMSPKLGLRDAVLMNGIFIHGLDFDDTSIFGRVHPSSFLVPCVLGMGAFVKASGKEALAAYIAGMECAIRIDAAARGGFPSIPLKPFMDEFWTLPIKEEVLPKILYKNALRVFKLEDDPTFKRLYG